MKARQLINDDPTFGPEDLKVIGKAFDDAWEQIAPGVGTRPAAIEAARLKLANVVLSLAANSTLDSGTLTEAALKFMFDEPTELRG